MRQLDPLELTIHCLTQELVWDKVCDPGIANSFHVTKSQKRQVRLLCENVCMIKHSPAYRQLASK